MDNEETQQSQETSSETETNTQETTTPETTTEETKTPEKPFSEQSEKLDAEASKDGDSEKTSDDAGDEPITYEPFTLPEGMEIAEADLAAFTELAQDMELSQEQAQKLVALESRRELARVEAEQQETDAMHAEWQESLKNHETLGGDNHAATLAALDLLAPALGEEATTFLQETKLIFHPALVPFFAMVGNSLKESPALLGNAGNSGSRLSPESRAQRMFANSGHQ